MQPHSADLKPSAILKSMGCPAASLLSKKTHSTFRMSAHVLTVLLLRQNSYITSAAGNKKAANANAPINFSQMILLPRFTHIHGEPPTNCIGTNCIFRGLGSSPSSCVLFKLSKSCLSFSNVLKCSLGVTMQRTGIPSSSRSKPLMQRCNLASLGGARS